MFHKNVSTCIYAFINLIRIRILNVKYCNDDCVFSVADDVKHNLVVIILFIADNKM